MLIKLPRRDLVGATKQQGELRKGTRSGSPATFREYAQRFALLTYM